ncbi:MAG: nucleoside triphosphate hydrolase [Paracoccaceae bacterium]|nr:MAG: nucleoside triphosphate hydrolase [Paracoccaceae bacterium]
MIPDPIVDLIRARANTRPGRFITALAGPPGAGKSTLAAAIAAGLGPGARVVPMDGFHYDDAVLNARGLRHRKGAPETFDATGFLHLVHRLRTEAEVAIPVFDRGMELSRAAADVVMPDDRFLIVEGNWLLLAAPPWADLAPLFDLTVMLTVPEPEIVRRLTDRWLTHGKTPDEAAQWIATNDLPNVRRVLGGSRPADLVIAG